jgi:multicomponent K+:H+ antiporter subunit A
MDGASLLLMILLPFAGCLAATFLPSNARNAEAWLASTVMLGGLLLTFAAYPQLASGGAIRYGVEWLPSLDVNLTLRMDGFAWLFALLINGIGFLVVLYARYYMSPMDPVSRFYALFLAFTGAMLGVVLSGNLILLVVFWELTSILSFLLIGYWYHNANARDGARMAVTVTGIGGLALLGGVLMIGHIVGSYDLDRVLDSGDLIRNHALYVPTLILVLLGCPTRWPRPPPYPHSCTPPRW